MEVCEMEDVQQPEAEQVALPSQSPLSNQIKSKSYAYPLLWNLHRLLPAATATSVWLTRANFAYFHYGCDGVPDNGWGCAYRTLQSMCSWILSVRGNSTTPVPSIIEIQETLVRIGDKPTQFIGSREWIGALEVFYVVDTLFDVSCKILHIPSRADLKKYANVLKKYFEDFGGFVMMGGNVDAASKGIAGIQITNNQAYFLVVDPHYASVPKNPQELIERGFVRWQHTSEFVDSSFYNICLPQLKV